MVPSASIAAVMDAPGPQVIGSTADYLRHLHDLAASHAELKKREYILRQLTESELDRKRRCSRCKRALKPKFRNWPRRNKKPPEAKVQSDSVASQGDVANSVPAAAPETSSGEASAADADPGAANNGADGEPPPQRWTCCNTPPMSKPCRAEAEHVPSVDAAGELQKNWRFFTTPAAPGPSRARPTWRVAVSIDCEMGTAESGESELIRVSVADYFSGATLLDSLVWPDAKMQHYNTRFSGVTRRDMLEARRRRTCLFGRSSARKAVWKHVGPYTIVVGHGANSDLGSLRWIHHRIVDTLLVEEAVAKLEEEKKEVEEAAVASGQGEMEDQGGVPDTLLVEEAVTKLEEEGKEVEEAAVASGQEEMEDQGGVPDTPTAQQRSGGRGWSLKALAHRRLDREIQKKGCGHDSVEDALAARDLLHWHIVNRVMEA